MVSLVPLCQVNSQGDVETVNGSVFCNPVPVKLANTVPTPDAGVGVAVGLGMGPDVAVGLWVGVGIGVAVGLGLIGVIVDGRPHPPSAMFVSTVCAKTSFGAT